MTITETTIWHNPGCGTSRNVLGMIRHTGVEPIVRNYLENPPDEAELREALDVLGLTPTELLRKRDAPEGLAEAGDEAVLAAMLENPRLIERPVVFTPTAARMCRPSELVLDLLPRLTTPFEKEDGTVVAPLSQDQGLPG